MKFCAFADEASPSVAGQIAALKRNGFEYLEVRGVNGVNVAKLCDGSVRELKKQLDGAGLAVWSVGSPIGKHKLSSNFDEQLEAHKRVTELAYMLGAHRIRMFSFFPIEGESNAATEERVFERLEKMCAVTPPDVILCHENEKHIFGETAESCLAIHKQFPSIRAVFDPANFVQCGVDTLKAWDMLKDYVDYLHIKDALSDGTVVPAGQGIGNVEQIVKLYLARGGSVMTLEPHLQSFVGLSGLENSESVKNLSIRYKDNDESFDTAAAALKAIIERI